MPQTPKTQQNKKKKRDVQAPFAVTMMASSMSGMVSRIPMHPVDTIKARMQVRSLCLSPLFLRMLSFVQS